MLESASTRDSRRRAREASEPSPERMTAVRTARRTTNRRKAAAAPAKDAKHLFEFECECVNENCERTVRVPLYVYGRILESGNQYLLQTGHHASPRYRTILAFGLTTIEEQI